MFGIVAIFLDMLALWAITSMLARQNLWDERFRFLICAAILIAIGLLTTIAAAPPLVILGAYFAAILISMKVIIGMSWLGSVLGGAIFFGYKLALTFLLNRL